MLGDLLINVIVLGRYLVIDLLDSAGQSNVYKGVEQRTKRFVAIKELAAHPSDEHFEEELARFRRAGSLRIGHPCVVDPIEAGEENGRHLIVFPYVEGYSPDRLVNLHGGRLPVNVVLNIFWDILEGLVALEALGIVHRDFKPGNIIVRPDGHAVIIDLGICRMLRQATLTRKTGGFGTPPWIPPEQQIDARQTDHRSDLYALGLIIRYLLTGQLPASSPNERTPVRYGSLTQLEPSVPAFLDRICLKMLEPKPEDRPQRAADIQLLLSEALSTPASGACRNCGMSLAPNAKYCTACAAPQNGNATSIIHCLACGSVLADTRSCSHCRATFSSAGHRLQFQPGHLNGRLFLIPESALSIGRPQLDPHNSYISRSQFHVVGRNGTVLLQDAGGPNPTLVAGRPAVKPIELQPGQEITVAGYLAVYSRLH